VSVISNLVAGTSAAPHVFYKPKPESIMQEFALPAGMSIRGFFSAFPNLPKKGGDGNNSNNSKNNSSSIKEAEVLDLKTMASVHQNKGSGTQLEGFYFWTSDAIFECRAKVIFIHMMRVSPALIMASILICKLLVGTRENILSTAVRGVGKKPRRDRWKDGGFGYAHPLRDSCRSLL